MMQHVDIAIIGGGPAGMAAAISAYDAGCRNILILEREEKLGGILRQCIHAGFGLHRFGQELTGPEYAHRFALEVKKRDISLLTSATVLDITPDKCITVTSPEKGLFRLCAKAIVLAMGCRERSRGALTIPGTRPAGIYTAGTAQKWINMEGMMPGKEIVILGSGDIGLIMARRLTLEGAKVHAVLELMPHSSGLTRNIVQCLNDFDIPLYLSHTVAEIHGKERITGITMARVDENRSIIEESKTFLPCDTLLLSCGLIPENELSRRMGLTISPLTKGVTVDETRQSAIPGVFACGNVLHVHDLVDYVSEEAEIAGRGAAAYVMQGEPPAQSYVTTTPGEGTSYLLPQRISKKAAGEALTLYFRPARVFGACVLVLLADGKEIKRIKKRRLAPGEMEQIKLSFALPDDTSTLTLMIKELDSHAT